MTRLGTVTASTGSPFDPAQFGGAIQEALDVFLDEQAERLAPLGADAAALIAEARIAVSGGKRLRAAFCHAGYTAVRPGARDEASERALLRACASLELLHASALVHDDYMDASDTRRGRASSHRIFEASHADKGWEGNAQQYGAAAAILLGDLLLTWADELLRRCGLPLAEVAPALDMFDLCRSEVVAGQFLDVSVQARGVADVDTAMTVLRYKSAKYSVERPLHIGAALAGASPEQIQALTDFGVPLGEAFQLRDDQLGVFGDPALTGKPAGDDLVEGKRTVLVAMALADAPSPEATVLDESLGTPLSEEMVDELRRIITTAGADTRVESLIDDLTTQALTALDVAPLDEGAKGTLRDLAAAATRRTT
jgi:geranylgeranyl diphosphate synthase, type I